MDSDPTFAKPLEKLGESGIGVAEAPTPGQGLALTPSGRVPFSTLPEPWRYPADEGLFQNSWSDAGAGILRVRFRKVAGIVFMEGQPTRATPPAAQSVIFTLPDGYWPQNSIHFLVPDVGAATPTVTEISASSAGIRFEVWNGGAGAMFPHIVISFSPYIP